jgi:hypothetical protein
LNETCRRYRERLLLEGLRDPAGSASDGHALACEPCRRFREAEREVAALLRSHRERTASTALRERVAAALEAEPGQDRRQWRRRRAMRVAAGAAALLLVLAGIGAAWLWARARGQRAVATAELMIEDHLNYARRADRLELAAAETDPLCAFFEREIGVAVRLPALPGATLVGGRRCHLGPRRAALAFYELRAARTAPADLAEPLSLFAFEVAGEDWSALEPVVLSGGRSVRCHMNRGVSVLVWEERGLVYALAGALPLEVLGRLLPALGS